MSNYNQLILTYENGLQDVITLTDSTIPYGEYQYMNIAAVEVPEIVTNIGPYAFCDNNNLSAITLSEGLRVIEGQAFQHGVYSSVTIPSTVQSIGENSFNLREEQMFGQAGDLYITCLATTPPMLSDLEGITFGLPEHLQAIYVPAGSVSAYQSAWSDYAAKIQALPTPPTPTTGFSTLDIVSAYVGTEIVERMYMGDELVWVDEPGPPTPIEDPMLREPLTFEMTSVTGNPTFALRLSGVTGTIMPDSSAATYVDYTVNGGNLQTLALTGRVEQGYITKNIEGLSNGDVVRFYGSTYGDGSLGKGGSAFIVFYGSNLQANVYGNINSLLVYKYYFDDFSHGDDTVPFVVSANTFWNLFSGCTWANFGTPTSEKHIVLPVPTNGMTKHLYSHLFHGCTSLTHAPILPATTLVLNCYRGMFRDCRNLSYIKCLATDISSSDCTYAWVANVANTGTFVKNNHMIGWPRDFHGIPNGWAVMNAPAFYETATTVDSGATSGSALWEPFVTDTIATVIPDTTAFSASSLVENISYSGGYITFDTLPNTGYNTTITIEAPSYCGTTSTLYINKKGELGVNWLDFSTWITTHTSADTLGNTVAIKQGSAIWAYITAGYLTDISGVTGTSSASTGVAYTDRVSFRLQRSNPYYSLKPTGTTAFTQATVVRTETIDGSTYDVYEFPKDMYISAGNTRFSGQITTGEMFIENRGS